MKRLYNRINKELLKEQLLADKTPRTTLSFYKYHHIDDPEALRDRLYTDWAEIGVLGRIYIASEGINGQLSVPKENFESFKEAIYSISFLNAVRLNVAIEDNGKSFFKLTIKIRNKIVADGLNDESFDVTKGGQHITAEKFNQLTDEPDTIVVDMRNHYESEVGHFDGAICPDVETFRESLPIVNEMLSDKKDNPIIMYCTGGIRCEKASAYMKHMGYQKVYQLDGGIIEYSRQAENQGLKNKFRGKNFVFDERLGEKISDETIAHCHQCGEPCDHHTNCANDACHILFLQCSKCAEKYNRCCSSKCHDFIELPEEEQNARRKDEVFNGTKFGKGRYKAHKKSELLE
jgi:UPF0176 protein